MPAHHQRNRHQCEKQRREQKKTCVTTFKTSLGLLSHFQSTIAFLPKTSVSWFMTKVLQMMITDHQVSVFGLLEFRGNRNRWPWSGQTLFWQGTENLAVTPTNFFCPCFSNQALTFLHYFQGHKITGSIYRLKTVTLT